MLELKGIQKSMGGQPVLRGVNLKIGSAEKVVVIGRSGCGKSVMLRIIMGLLTPEAGEVFFEGTRLTGLSEEAWNPYRKKIGMLFQGAALFDSLSVFDNLAFPLREHGEKNENVLREKVTEALKIVSLSGTEEKMPAELSGGMKKRAALARAIICRPALMLYDEPTTGLDPIVADSINRLILHLGKMLGMASIVVTHDMTSARMVGDRIAYLHEGKIYFQGTPDQVDKCEDPLVRDFVRGHAQGIDVVG
jgi:phospholipid/cholesterol/gamma-HCH transport system ATP-binding protein